MPQVIPNEISAKFVEPEGRRELMKRYGDTHSMFSGINEDGESVCASIAQDNIVVSTFQDNGWVRVNYYDGEGFPCGETFDGKYR